MGLHALHSLLQAIALSIRQEIEAATGCTASAGISCNKLLAKLATNQAKPDGQFLLTLEQVS